MVNLARNVINVIDDHAYSDARHTAILLKGFEGSRREEFAVSTQD